MRTSMQEPAVTRSSKLQFKSGNKSGKPRDDGGNGPAPRVQLTFLAIADLTPGPRNPRKHDRAQVRAIARSIEAFGFNAPILIDRHKQIIAGHGRYEAAKLNGSEKVPVICLDYLTEA